jgi:hypothetical protein
VRSRLAVMTLVCVLLTGCGARDPASSGPNGGGGTTPPATTPVAAQPLTGQGIGPYVMGAELDALTATAALTNVKTTDGCPDFTTADAGGPYFGTVRIVFYQKKIAWITIGSAVVSTVDGARVGLKLAAVKGIYGSKANQLSDGRGGEAVGVRDGAGTGLLFRGAADGTVATIDAGTYDTLEFRFIEGEGC